MSGNTCRDEVGDCQAEQRPGDTRASTSGSEAMFWKMCRGTTEKPPHLWHSVSQSSGGLIAAVDRTWAICTAVRRAPVQMLKDLSTVQRPILWRCQHC